MSKRYVFEFGVRGGQHDDNIVVPTLKVGAKLASSMVRVFNDNCSSAACSPDYWAVGLLNRRKVRVSDTHFVALTMIDENSFPNGCASASLWKK